MCQSSYKTNRAVAGVMLCLSAVPCIAAHSQTAAPANQADRDKQFLEYQWQNNQAEIQLGINAQKLAQAPAVIAFARLIVSDNSDLKNQLGSVMKENHVVIPAEMVQQRANMIAPKTGADFDQAFIASQITHLRDDIARYQDQNAAAKNEGVEKVTSFMAPMLQQELALALAVQATLHPGETTTTSPH